MQKKFAGKIQFVLVYLREAHPSDGWAVRGWSTMKDPLNLKGRKTNGTQCCKLLKFEFPATVDKMDDSVAVRWSGWPERLFVISKTGKLVYTGDQGPFGFRPSASYSFGGGRRGGGGGIHLEGFLDAYLANPKNRKSTGTEKTEPAKKDGEKKGEKKHYE